MNKNISSEKLKKELSKNFEQTNLLTKSALKPHLVVKELAVENDEAPEKQRVLELKIPLNSWSPKYELFKGFSYREKIDINAFDAEVPIESQDINSYLDHKMSIENLLASTKNKSMSVEKSGEEIIAKIKVDESDDKLKKVANLIADGIVESNSFIFKSEEVDYIEHFKDKNSTSEVDLEIIYKKGKLISIDPVYQGFFPQAKCQVYDKNNNNFSDFKLELKNLYEPKQEKEVPNMEQKEELKTVETVEKEELKTVETVVRGQKVPGHFTPEQRANAELAKNLTASLYSRNTKLTTYDSLKTKFLRRQLSPNDDISATFMSQMWDRASETYSTEKIALEELKWTSASSYEYVSKALDGTSALKGLALVENILQPNILSGMNYIFPEFTELAQKVPLEGLNTIDKAIYIPDNKEISKIAEDTDATALGGQTFTTKIVPSRYSVVVSQNRALSHGAELWQKQTENAKNRIIRGLRKDFYNGLFRQADQTLTTLVTATASNYSGGATKEAKIDSAVPLNATFSDLENLTAQLIADYGSTALSNLVILTHIDTMTLLEKPYMETLKPLMLPSVYDNVKRTYRGIPIVASTLYPDKPNVSKAGNFDANKKPFLILDKSAIVAYGLTFVTEDDPFTDMSKNRINRYVQTRGEIKLCDPNVSTRFIQIKAS